MSEDNHSTANTKHLKDVLSDQNTHGVNNAFPLKITANLIFDGYRQQIESIEKESRETHHFTQGGHHAFKQGYKLMKSG